MFGLGRKPDQEAETKDAASSPRYDKPKVLLVDMGDDCLAAVRRAGFNVSSGSFGTPYRNTPREGYAFVKPPPHLNNASELEVIFINLRPPRIEAHPEQPDATDQAAPGWWAEASARFIDPRPLAMHAVLADFDRVFEHGGIFVVFVMPRDFEVFWRGHIREGMLDLGSSIARDNWGFLSALLPHCIKTTRDDGQEVTLADGLNDPLHFLEGYFREARFYTRVEKESGFNNGPCWGIPLARNKFGDCVGQILGHRNGHGVILLLPQIARQTDLAVELLQNTLPRLRPAIFPHFEGQRWTERAEYELLPILEHKAKIARVKQRAEAEVRKLEIQIAAAREESKHLHGILSHSGDELVADVKQCLEKLGFAKVVDADAEKDGNQQLEEDLRIEDGSPLILVEVKGLGRQPGEGEAVQIVKYTARRMKALERIDVRGLVIVNHQRHLPPLDRDNENVFTKTQIGDAVNHEYTLASTWDLFRLLRGLEQWNWPPESVRSLLTVPGRMPAIPGHYQPVGHVAKHWPEAKVISIEVKNGALSLGDRIGIVTPTGFLEQNVDSMERDSKPIERAEADQRVGIATHYTKDDCPINAVVCRIDMLTAT